MESLSVISGILTHGVGHLCISEDGKKLAATGLDPKHCIVIYDLDGLLNKYNPSQNDLEYIIATGRGPRQKILDIAFAEDGKSIACSCYRQMYQVSWGQGHLVIKKGQW